MTDPESFPRRKLLWTLTTIGAAASTGSGAAALLSDSETLGESAVTAGVVDLEAKPSWGNDDSLGTISAGESGSRTVELTVSDNPSYIWFRTDCKQCLQVEDALYVRYGVDTDGDGQIDLPITGGYISLAEARDRYGTGQFIGTLDPTETWTFVAEWEPRERAKSTDVPLSFDFYAAQTRHVSDPDNVALPRSWPETCSDCGGPSIAVSGISWAAFCGESTFDTEFTPELDGPRTLLLDAVPDGVERIVLKYGQTMEVFTVADIDGSSITVGRGDGTTYQHEKGNTFGNTDLSNPNFCGGEAGCKYEFDEDNWECADEQESEDPGPPDDPGNRKGNKKLDRIDRVRRDSLGGER